MTIELWDMDVPYEIKVDCTSEGVDFIRICPNSAQKDRVEDVYDLALDYDRCQELIRVLTFMSNEISR